MADDLTGTRVVNEPGTTLKVDGSAVTQPVSVSSIALPTNAAKESGGNLASIAAATDVALSTRTKPADQQHTILDTSIPTGSNTIGKVDQGLAGASAWKVDGSATTQPVSGTVTASQGTAASLAATVTQGPAGATAWKVDGSAVTQPVSGTFFQATQPVSGTVTASQGTAANLLATVTQGGAGATAWKVDGSATTQPVSGTVSANASQVGTWTVQPGNTPNSTPWLTKPGDGTNTISVTAKATQGTNGLAVQDLKDAGRQQILLSWERVAGTAAAESALTNFTNGTRNATALTAASSYTVSSGKTLRIQSVNVALTSTSTVVNNARIRIRQAASSISNASPIIWNLDVPWPSTGTVAANMGVAVSVPIPDGLEVAATQQITLTWITAAASCTVTTVIIGYEY